MGTSHEDQYIFLIISRSFLHRIKNILDKFAEKLDTHISCKMTFFS
jgi:hypothetical protein